MRAALVAGVLAFGILTTFVLVWPAHADGAAPDPRLILQTQASLAAHAQITGAITTDYVAPLYLHIDNQYPEWILGDYQPSGMVPADAVKLLVHRDGWAVSYFPRNIHVGHMLDPRVPGGPTNRIEKTIAEVAAALGVTSTVTSVYDFRRPAATGITLHWMINNQGVQDQTATLTLPLANSYLERGYFFGTAYTNSRLWVNGELIREANPVTVPLFFFGELAGTQLRGGQTNSFRMYNFSIFGNAFVAGVGVEYSGSAEIAATGGFTRTLSLSYPAFLGTPLDIQSMYLPLIRR